MVLEENFVDTLDCQKDKQVSPRANQAWTCSGGGKMMELRLSCFGHIMRRQDYLEKDSKAGKG